VEEASDQGFVLTLFSPSALQLEARESYAEALIHLHRATSRGGKDRSMTLVPIIVKDRQRVLAAIPELEATGFDFSSGLLKENIELLLTNLKHRPIG
jgi:hypothetical protein